jgi:hypothetical protein
MPFQESPILLQVEHSLSNGHNERSNPMKRVLIIMAVFFPLLAGCVSKSEYTKVQEQLSELQAAATSTSGDKSELKIQLESVSGELQVIQTELETTQRENEVALQQAETDKINSIIEIEEKYQCPDYPISVDYKNNYSVGQSLISYVEKSKVLDEPISANYWKAFWTGEKHSLHTVEVYSSNDNMTYLWEFVVYFRGEASGEHPNGVFWTGRGCWLDYQE